MGGGKRIDHRVDVAVQKAVQRIERQTDAMIGSVGIACKMSHSVVYLKMKHVSRGKYEMEFIKLADNAADHTPEEIMRKYYDVLEAEINETPHNWLWTHKRWK